MKALYNKLSDKQKKTMEKHSKHHSKKHMMAMAKMMVKGTSFNSAHKKAMKEIGK